jgi:hypothetical protein
MSKSMTAVLTQDTNFYSSDSEEENSVTVTAGSEVPIDDAFYAPNGDMYVSCSTTIGGDKYSTDVRYTDILPRLAGVTDKVFKA